MVGEMRSGFMAVAQNYPMGSAVRMGPAYFPTVLGGLLAVLGAMVLFLWTRSLPQKNKRSNVSADREDAV